MKRILITALILSTISLGLLAGTESNPKENLSPLTFMLGEWKLKWINPDGQEAKGRASFKAEAGGTIITARNEVLAPDGSTVFSRFSLFFWDGQRNALTESYHESSGWHGSLSLAKSNGNKLLWKGTVLSPEGAEAVRNLELVKLNANSWTAQFVEQSMNGHSQPDSPKFLFTRSK